MSDAVDDAAEAMWGATCSDGLRAAMRPDCIAMAAAVDAAGLLATPAHAAAVAAKALRDSVSDLERRLSDPALIESADRSSGYYAGVRSAMQREAQLLHERADRIEREGVDQ